MALPSSGPLSFQDIATELGVNPPLSLASMSTTAGFTAPYAVTDFYGYSGGGIVTDGLVVNLDAGNSSSYSGTGTTWTDISGNGNNVTLINAPTYSSNNGGYLTFNASNQYGEGTDLDLDYITIEGWVYSTANGNNGYVINKNYNGGVVPYSLSLGNTPSGVINGIAFYAPNWVQSTVGTNIMGSNTWYQVVGTFDGITLKYYLNASLNASSSPPYNILPKNDNVFNVGLYQNDGNYFGGNISIIRMYNRALTSTEITTNFNADKSRYGL
jgi:hypothetical protein